MVCKNDLPHIEKIVEWVTVLQTSMGDDNQYEECMIKETKEGLRDIFCKGEESVAVMENMLKFIANWCCDESARSYDRIVCGIVKWLHQGSRNLVYGFGPLICAIISEQSQSVLKRNENPYIEFDMRVEGEDSEKKKIGGRLEKRQYDLSSMVKLLRNLVCNKDTFLQIAKYVEDELAEDQEGITNLASLLHGVLCCTLVAIQA